MNACEVLMTHWVRTGSSSFAPKSANIFWNDGMTKIEEDREDAGEDDQDRGRVEERALDLALQLHVLLDVDRQAVQDRVEDTADLSGLDEVAVERVEDLRVPAERVAEGRALLHVRLHVAQDDLEELVVRLVPEDVEALHDGQTGVDHRREEAREGDQIFLADARADLEVCPLGLLLDLGRVELLGAQARLDRVLGLGLHHALPDLSGLTSGFPCELGHIQSPIHRPLHQRPERPGIGSKASL